MKVASLTEVKNGLSGFVALVRRGERVRILSHGVPVAEIVPVETGRADDRAGEALLAGLERRGIVRRGRGGIPPEIWKPGPRGKGKALSDYIVEERRSSR